jgi:hypothetical protein
VKKTFIIPWVKISFQTGCEDRFEVFEQFKLLGGAARMWCLELKRKKLYWTKKWRAPPHSRGLPATCKDIPDPSLGQGWDTCIFTSSISISFAKLRSSSQSAMRDWSESMHLLATSAESSIGFPSERTLAPNRFCGHIRPDKMLCEFMRIERAW